MSNTSITNLQITDTFQVWIDKTNEIIDLANENIMLAGPGAGFTVQGNSTLTGTFTANTITANTTVSSNLSVVNITRSIDANERIIANSPVRISTGVENIFDLQTTAGNRPIVRMINGANARWLIEHDTSASNTAISIKTEGASTPQVTISQSGRLTTNELQGNGSLLTNLNANNVSSGTLNVGRIPDLDASKITTGTFSVARIPDLNASKITDGVFALARIPNLPASRITSGTIDVARIPDLNANKITAGTLDVARIPDLNANKITDGVLGDSRIPNTIVRTSRRLFGANGVSISGNGDFSADRTISVPNLSPAQVQSSTDSTFGMVSGQRLSQSIEENTNAVLVATSKAAFGAVGTYAWLWRRSGGFVQGTLVPGSELFPAAVISGAGGLPGDGELFNAGLTRGPTSMTGTWRAMGRSNNLTGDVNRNRQTLWLRVA